MTNKEAVEFLLTDESNENSLINQPFIQKISGEDDLDFDVDFDTAIDTDMDRNPYKKDQILVQINDAKKSTISSIENETSRLTASIKEWAEKVGLDIYFDDIYTNDDNQVTIIFDVPADDSYWNYNEFKEEKEKPKRNLDEIETIADQKWKDYNGKASYDDYLQIFKIGYKSNKSDSKKESKSDKAENGILVDETIVVNPMAIEVDAVLKEKYGVTTNDIGVNDDWWANAKDKNYSTQQIVDMLTKDYSLTPINPEKEHSKIPAIKSEKSHYICLVKDSRNNILGKYELAYNDEDYAKMFLEAIGVRLRNGDKMEIE
jgi:hypothetical protein